ncbi:MAG: transglycosylase SLT domain-containing protein [Gammaproteobacteria bacterium]|nr:transglycosylase SLT domain-containing protein [Gammaproteobacteria bacterium]
MKMQSACKLFLGWLLCAPMLTMAASTASAVAPTDLSRQRADFQAAEKALQRKNRTKYLKLRARLTSYPLYPYLEFQDFALNPGRLTGESTERFIETYTDSPLTGRLRNIWLGRLAKRQQWSEYKDFYRPTRNTRRRCLYLQAQLNTGDEAEALNAVEDVWLHGKSQPSACDPVFKAWREAGWLTRERVWKRITLAMGNREQGLARYLGKFLSTEDARYLTLWLKVHQQPRLILDPDAFAEPHPYRSQVLLYGLERLARKDPNTADTAWEQISGNYRFDADQNYLAQRAIALGWLRKPGPNLFRELNKITPRDEDTRLLESRLRSALSRQAWNWLLTWIDDLPPSLAETDRWRYWKGRALEETDQKNEAVAVFADLSAERSYHGFLAADKTGKAYHLANHPLQVPLRSIERLSSKPGIARAGELVLLKRFREARREWRAATEGLDTDDLKAAAKVAHGWGWHDQAIFTLARTGYWDDLDFRFPIEHTHHIDKARKSRKLDKSWVLAVIRQESAFAMDARSSAGALGLMQLMPATARQVARQLKHPLPRKNKLLQPSTNIELGTAYLGEVLDQLDNNVVLATAAYNAGPHRVRRWLPDETIPADVWVDTIPFKETRRYTRRVLSYSVIYDKRLGKKPRRLKNSMPSVKPRKKMIATGAGARTKSKI